MEQDRSPSPPRKESCMEVTRVPFPPVDRHQCSPVVELLLDKNDEGLFDDSIRYEEFPKWYSGSNTEPNEDKIFNIHDHGSVSGFDKELPVCRFCSAACSSTGEGTSNPSDSGQGVALPLLLLVDLMRNIVTDSDVNRTDSILRIALQFVLSLHVMDSTPPGLDPPFRLRLLIKIHSD